jgi:hypothetical protein
MSVGQDFSNALWSGKTSAHPPRNTEVTSWYMCSTTKALIVLNFGEEGRPDYPEKNLPIYCLASGRQSNPDTTPKRRRQKFSNIFTHKKIRTFYIKIKIHTSIQSLSFSWSQDSNISSLISVKFWFQNSGKNVILLVFTNPTWMRIFSLKWQILN